MNNSMSNREVVPVSGGQPKLKKAPDFALPNQDNKIVRLRDFRGFKVVLFSFPQAGTPECTRQACAYRDAYARFTRSHTMVLGITSSRLSLLREWREANQFPYDLLSDKHHDTLKRLGAWGHDLGLFELPFARRGYWVIDEQGYIQHQNIGLSPLETVEQSLAHVENSTPAGYTA
jgi:peroxiredoxin Q/BCP